ncbi:hypothetical protein VUR80DRAFT_8306 [Thermomyces stellatus]
MSIFDSLGIRNFILLPPIGHNNITSFSRPRYCTGASSPSHALSSKDISACPPVEDHYCPNLQQNNNSYEITIKATILLIGRISFFSTFSSFCCRQAQGEFA